MFSWAQEKGGVAPLVAIPAYRWRVLPVSQSKRSEMVDNRQPDQQPNQAQPPPDNWPIRLGASKRRDNTTSGGDDRATSGRRSSTARRADTTQRTSTTHRWGHRRGGYRDHLLDTRSARADRRHPRGGRVRRGRGHRRAVDEKSLKIRHSHQFSS